MKDVGFIGLGIMGKPMALNLLKAGYSVGVLNTNGAADTLTQAGARQTTKACNQMIVGMTIQAVSEAFALAQKAGVDLEKMREVLLGDFAQSRILDLHGRRIIDRNFAPGFKIKLHKKDLTIALQTGDEFSVPLPGTALVAGQMEAAVNQGNGELDHSSLVLLIE